MTDQPELKACPFCGSTPKYSYDGANVCIYCDQCRQASIESRWYNNDLGTTEAAWNTRADLTPKWQGIQVLRNIVAHWQQGGTTMHWCQDLADACEALALLPPPPAATTKES